MAGRLIVVSLGQHTRLGDILEYALDGRAFDTVTADMLPETGLDGRRILFAISLDGYGMQPEALACMRYLRAHPRALEGAAGALLLDSETELYTKDLARTFILDANFAGCRFIARPLVEATGSLRNFDVLSGIHGVDRFTAYQRAARTLIDRLSDDAPARAERPNILMLHASNRASSNTLALALETARLLANTCDVTELSLHTDAIYDCNGCAYKACVHYAEWNACFYGGVVPEEVFPAIERCDALLLCCPNYNDAPGAHFLALNNRLNALLLRGTPFRKALFAIVVSGYSGGDIVAKQLLGGYCLNKPFSLPPRFALLETASAPCSVLQQPGIDTRLLAFARNIEAQLRL